ncbi:MAG: hypothetical protein GY719_41040 [bacterium]|nr:hypothetical protein [bacterium]
MPAYMSKDEFIKSVDEKLDDMKVSQRLKNAMKQLQKALAEEPEEEARWGAFLYMHFALVYHESPDP